MNNADNNQQSSADSEQSKADVLRAKDTIPPLKAPAGPTPASQKPPEEGPNPPAIPASSSEPRTAPISVNLPQPEPKPAASTPAVSPTQEQAKSDIPRFDLAEKIMAEQRRITAVRRKGPGQQDETQGQERKTERAGDIKEPAFLALSEQEQIIAEIVARDIERLCRDPISKVSK